MEHQGHCSSVLVAAWEENVTELKKGSRSCKCYIMKCFVYLPTSGDDAA